jgi:hypothetical protein
LLVNNYALTATSTTTHGVIVTKATNKRLNSGGNFRK